MTGYEIYSAWCRERGQVPPTKEWWDWACSRKVRDAPLRQLTRNIRADQAEIDRERREGWAYD